MRSDKMFVRACSEDVPSIIGLRHRIWSTTYRGIYPDCMIDDFAWDWHREKELARVNDPAYAVYLIRKGQQDIGYLTIHQADGVTLQSLYIVSEYQRNGIGRRAFDLVRRTVGNTVRSLSSATAFRRTIMPECSMKKWAAR